LTQVKQPNPETRYYLAAQWPYIDVLLKLHNITFWLCCICCVRETYAYVILVFTHHFVLWSYIHNFNKNLWLLLFHCWLF